MLIVFLQALKGDWEDPAAVDEEEEVECKPSLVKTELREEEEIEEEEEEDDGGLVQLPSDYEEEEEEKPSMQYSFKSNFYTGFLLN